MSDKLAEIQQRYRDDPNMYWIADMDWLLAEIERLRERLAGTEQQLLEVLQIAENNAGTTGNGSAVGSATGGGGTLGVVSFGCRRPSV